MIDQFITLICQLPQFDNNIAYVLLIAFFLLLLIGMFKRSLH